MLLGVFYHIEIARYVPIIIAIGEKKSMVSPSFEAKNVITGIAAMVITMA